MKFNQVKLKVRHLERNKSKHQERLGANQLENSFAEKDVQVLVDNKLIKSQ